MKTTEELLRKSIRLWITIFIIALVLSGITAFPIETELAFLSSHGSFVPDYILSWINTVYHAIRETNRLYPFLSYGTDWLAFAHIVIAIAFIGPWREPVRNIWVLQFGMIACLAVLPLALIAGAVRGIPFYWQVIDCSFGIVGIIPLYLCYRKIKQLEELLIQRRDS